MPEFTADGALLHVYLMLCRPDHGRHDAESERAAASGENIVVGKGMQRRDEAIRNCLLLHQRFHLVDQLAEERQSLFHRSGGTHIHACPAQQIDGLLLQPPDRKPR